mmetsp:Transcript_12571/g.16507  ORF Transcript_12571/g.16507 Transcript_12571/m.16507 type:complete len:428 (+) Transcript_12571:53-1336(+)|eukprot:CAMPEP_0117756334 /NCGR_PEP_ID=MMETSP0947-20121206/14011_1 /TAXON_ID=44440 /ORGANISM="Chattonella subsalsa, Strain CCMP2191" /LENGTH=427 /DNA_ID=CAMNT_0005575891 /DNA_START=36 /DNA_END=1319 /DNA_ORIENTATION=+
MASLNATIGKHARIRGVSTFLGLRNLTTFPPSITETLREKVLPQAVRQCALTGKSPEASLLKKLQMTPEAFQSLVNEEKTKGSEIWQPERGITATVFGAGGFLGRYVCQGLANMNARAYLPNRGCEMELRHLKPLFDQNCLGQVAFPFYSPRDDDSIRAAMAKSDIVINLIGKYYQPKHVVPVRKINGKPSRINYTFEEMNVEIPAKIARFAKEMGIRRVIHVSALSSDKESTSDFARTKAEGEEAVKAEFPSAVVVRPAIMYGPEDRFLNWFATAAEKSRFIPLVNGGSPLVQPVYVTDVAKAIEKIVVDAKYDGKTFDLAGEEDYTWKEVAEFVYDITEQKHRLVNMPGAMAEKLGEFTQELAHPVWTKDIAIQQSVDNILDPDSPNLTFADLDIKPRSMEDVAFYFLHRFREGGHFLHAEGYHL